MSDLILSLEEATVMVGNKIFFEGLSFPIHRGSKIAVVGKNGAGKTTLLNLICGVKELDEGKYWILPGITIGMMRQEVHFSNEKIGDYIFSGMSAHLEDWDKNARIEMILHPLRLDINMEMSECSGGQLRRVELARALVEQPDILLMDEPTNHCDLEIIEWLEQYLINTDMTILVISHDREFLARVTNRVFWLDRQKLKISPSGFRNFAQWSEELLAQEWRSLENRASRVAIEMNWAQRGVKARVKRNVRRLNQAFEANEKLDNDIRSYKRATRVMDQPVVEFEQSSDIIVEFYGVSKSYMRHDAEKIILQNYSLRIKRGEKIGILGANGSGKTNFLKLIIGEITPDKGKVKLGTDVTFTYFDQFRLGLNGKKTIQQNLCPIGTDHIMVRGKSRHICGYIKDYLFQADDAWRAVDTLSGGQKNRIYLAKILANPGNFMILDEPTNDLDMDTLDMVEDVLDKYQGTLIVVSHDRDFLNNTVDKLLVFEGDGHIATVVGGWDDYEAYRAEKKANKPQQTQTAKAQKPNKTANTPNNIVAPAETAPIMAQPPAPKNKKVSFSLKHEYEKLPAKIEECNQIIKILSDKLANPDYYNQNRDEFYQSTDELEKAKARLSRYETRWLELSEMIEG